LFIGYHYSHKKCIFAKNPIHQKTISENEERISGYIIVVVAGFLRVGQ